MTGSDAGGDPAHSLEADDVKLVAFTMVSIRRGAERALPGPLAAGMTVVTDSQTGEAFVGWVIARYLGALSGEERRALQQDLRYLRVDWVVSHRWPREPLEFERRQVEALSAIRGTLAG